jgi:hypothetical protein
LSTTGSNFVAFANGEAMLVGTTVQPAGVQVLALNPTNAFSAVIAGGTAIDRVVWDLGMTGTAPGIGSNILAFGAFIGGFAKNGAIYVTFTGTTPVSLDLTNIGASIGVTFAQGGDTSLATINALILQNQSATSVITIAPGASNGARFPVLAGTSPTLSLNAGSVHCLSDLTGQAVDSTHKILTFTPSAGGTLLLAYGGA